MVKKQFIHLNNKKQFSALVFDLEQRIYEELPLFHHIHLTKEDKKICIGFYDLKEQKEHHCGALTDLSDAKYTRCKQCEILTGFSDCIRCNGLSCDTSITKAIQYCNQDHVVYLAYFPGGVVKVGTSLFKRREERILEQGAVAALFIYRPPNGKIAREIEYHVGLSGVKTRVNMDYKLKNLVVDKTESEIKRMLVQIFHDLHLPLEPFRRFMIEPVFFSQYYWFSKIKKSINDGQGQLTLDFFNQSSYTNEEYEIHKDYHTVKGEVVACAGSILVVKNINNRIAAYDVSKMKGYLVQLHS